MVQDQLIWVTVCDPSQAHFFCSCESSSNNTFAWTLCLESSSLCLTATHCYTFHLICQDVPDKKMDRWTSSNYSPVLDWQPCITYPETKEGSRRGERLGSKKIRLCLQLRDVQPFCSSAVFSTITVGDAQQCSWEVLVHWNSPSVLWYELTELRRTSQEAQSNFTSWVCNFHGKMLICEVILLIKFTL